MYGQEHFLLDLRCLAPPHTVRVKKTTYPVRILFGELNQMWIRINFKMLIRGIMTFDFTRPDKKMTVVSKNVDELVNMY